MADLIIWSNANVIQSTYAHYIIFGCSIFALGWGGFNALRVKKIKMEAEHVRAPEEPTTTKINEEDVTKQWTGQDCLDEMVKINKLICEGADEFLKKEYMYLAIFCALFACVLLCAVDIPWDADAPTAFPITTFCFLIGAFTSMAAGFIGMKIATQANVKTTYLCNKSKAEGFNAAFWGGQVLGFCLVGLALLILEVLILIFKNVIVSSDPVNWATIEHQVRLLFEFISGYGLGGSTVALFGRVGGGIYTKAADVGADLAGKVMSNLKEDSPDNPGTIADNVGDNVGDIAGMGADLFGSLAEATCAALVVACSAPALISTPDAMYFPLVVTSVGVITSFITVWFSNIDMTVENKLKTQLIVSTLLTSAILIPVSFMLPEAISIEFGTKQYDFDRWMAYGCIMLGLWSGLAIGLATEYYTSHSYRPTRDLAEACRIGAAPNIIKGLALGYMSNIIPIACLAVTVLFSFQWAAMYGIALAALGMLGCLPIALTIDGYGPISDNAGGIAEMSNLHPDIRDITDDLDAAGNTTAAIGKGFAIGSACLVALALFGAFVTRVADAQGNDDFYNVNILEPFTFAGLLVGAMLPYAFSALTMSAVGTAAEEMIVEIKDQIDNNRVDPTKCVSISTTASLKKMIAPGCIVILSPLVAGALFGASATSGVLAGNIVSGIQIAFSASNTGGAWDNAKKYVEAGLLENTEKDKVKTGREFVQKHDDAHHAAICGDTVGDPLKDTSGPSINILIKLSAITALVFGTFIARYGALLL